MVDLPNGTVTLLFTDVEGSTQLVRQLGERYGLALERQRSILRAAVEDAGGREIDCRGDELFAAFPRARVAVTAAVAAQRALSEEAWPDNAILKVRMGLHTGEPALQDDGYLGLDVHRAARIGAAAHGGQVLVSNTTRELAAGDPSEFRDLGEYELKDLPAPERLFQVVIAGLPADFPAPKTAGASPAAGRERELAAAARKALAGPRRLFERLRPQQKRGFADLGWDVRGLIGTVPREGRDVYSDLARDLFDAARTAADADAALDVVDRKLLVQRLHAQREQGVLSNAAERDAEVTQQRLAALDALSECRGRAESIAADVRATIREPHSAAELTALGLRLRQASEDLNGALDAAGREFAAVGARLRRTRHRGVFRVGERFVVPFDDELGAERRREFPTIADAVAFRRAVRIGQRAESAFSQLDSVEQETTHLSGYATHWDVSDHANQRRR
jgi:class 3 adenylate cyclase